MRFCNTLILVDSWLRESQAEIGIVCYKIPRKAVAELKTTLFGPCRITDPIVKVIITKLANVQWREFSRTILAMIS